MTDIRLCSVETNGPIKEMGNITGPIRKCRLELPKILSMINNGHVIYELNPENLSDRVRLTLTNAIPSPFSKSKLEPINKIESGKSNVGGIVGTVDKSNDNKKDEPSVINAINTPKELDKSDETVNETNIENITLPETKSEIEDVDIENTPSTPQFNNQNQYNKYDKKNKHKHNKNNYNNNVAKQTTVEEKVVKSDF